MVKVCFDAVLNCGAYIPCDEVVMKEDWTMCQLVNYLRFLGVKKFRLVDTMKCFVEIPA